MAVGLVLTTPRKADRRTELDDLRMELIACGQEMRAMAERISNSLMVEDIHTAMRFAQRLWVLGDGYADPEGRAD